MLVVQQIGICGIRPVALVSELLQNVSILPKRTHKGNYSVVIINTSLSAVCRDMLKRILQLLTFCVTAICSNGQFFGNTGLCGAGQVNLLFSNDSVA